MIVEGEERKKKKKKKKMMMMVMMALMTKLWYLIGAFAQYSAFNL